MQCHVILLLLNIQCMMSWYSVTYFYSMYIYVENYIADLVMSILKIVMQTYLH